MLVNVRAGTGRKGLRAVAKRALPRKDEAVGFRERRRISRHGDFDGGLDREGRPFDRTFDASKISKAQVRDGYAHRAGATMVLRLRTRVC